MRLDRTGVASALALLLMAGGASPALGADGRAYELVSPADKNGNAVDVRSGVQSSPGGDAVAFSLPGAVGDAPTSVSGGYYVSRRAGDWSAASIDAPQSNGDAQITNPSLYLSRDLGKTVQFSRDALAPGAIAGGSNLFQRDNATGARALVAASPGKRLADELVLFGGPLRTLGGSDDLSHFVFSSGVALTPDAAPFTTNVYEWVNGQLRLASYLPDGTVDPGGAQTYSYAQTSRPMSSDGERIVFESPSQNGNGPLHIRIGGTRTVSISVSRRPGDPTTPQPARFGAASRDGGVVYFMSDIPLTPDASGGYQGDLYRYDVDTDELTNLTVLTDPADTSAAVASVQEVSEDGEYVYFTAKANLTGDGVSGEPSLYVAHGNALRRIGGLDPTTEYPGPPSTALSPNGRYLAFTSNARMTTADNRGMRCKPNGTYGNADGICTSLYVYDAVADSLTCASCTPVDGELRFADLGPQTPSISEHVGRAVLDSGQVFFNAYARLLPEDVNGRRDAYEWRDGQLSLISTGRSSQESTFAEASLDGRDVFFFTTERLVKRDFDNEADLYDARIGGGIPAQDQTPPSPVDCDGDGCQGALGSQPATPVLGSVVFSAPPDPLLPLPPKQGSVRVTTKRSVRGTALTLRVSTPARGRISVAGARLRSVAKTVAKGGTHSVMVRLTQSGKSALKRRGTLTVSMRVVFKPASGSTSSTTVRVTLKA
jgi:hypothetical protein